MIRLSSKMSFHEVQSFCRSLPPRPSGSLRRIPACGCKHTPVMEAKANTHGTKQMANLKQMIEATLKSALCSQSHKNVATCVPSLPVQPLHRTRSWSKSMSAISFQDTTVSQLSFVLGPCQHKPIFLTFRLFSQKSVYSTSPNIYRKERLNQQ